MNKSEEIRPTEKKPKKSHLESVPSQSKDASQILHELELASQIICCPTSQSIE